MQVPEETPVSPIILRHGPLALSLMELDDFLAASIDGGPRHELWVFGYGSLMWSPDFPLASSSPALLRGYHRALCIYSHRYRGTPAKPGLVMGLRRGGACWGMAFHVRSRDARGALTALWQREMRNKVYVPRFVPVTLRGPDELAPGKLRRSGRPQTPGRRIRALAFIADPAHRQYTCELSLEQTAELVAQGRGERGRNIEYLAQTVAHMDVLGVRDLQLRRTLELALVLRARRSGG